MILWYIIVAVILNLHYVRKIRGIRSSHPLRVKLIKNFKYDFYIVLSSIFRIDTFFFFFIFSKCISSSNGILNRVIRVIFLQIKTYSVACIEDSIVVFYFVIIKIDY